MNEMIRYQEVLAATQEREAWLHDRRAGIGGSDWEDILEGPHGCRYRFWLEKRGVRPDIPQVETDPMRKGKELEIGLLREVSLRMKMDIEINVKLEPRGLWKGNADGILANGEVVECKHTNSFSFRQWENGGLSIGKIAQVMHYIYLRDAVSGRFAVRCYDDLTRVTMFPIQRNNELIDKMLEAGEKVWKYVENGPDPEHWKKDKKDCKKCPFFVNCHGEEALQPGEESATVENDQDGLVDDLLIQLVRYREMKAEAEELYDGVRGQLVTLAKAALPKGTQRARVYIGSPRVALSLYPVTRETVDKRKLRTDLKEQAEKYIKATTTIQSRFNLRGEG